MNDTVLKGVKVVDLTQYIAGFKANYGESAG